MESMKKLIGRFSLFISVLAFVTCMLNGISIGTSLLRSFMVYIGMIFLFVVSLKILRWGLLLAGRPKASQNETVMETKTN